MRNIVRGIWGTRGRHVVRGRMPTTSSYYHEVYHRSKCVKAKNRIFSGDWNRICYSSRVKLAVYIRTAIKECVASRADLKYSAWYLGSLEGDTGKDANNEVYRLKCVKNRANLFRLNEWIRIYSSSIELGVYIRTATIKCVHTADAQYSAPWYLGSSGADMEKDANYEVYRLKCVKNRIFSERLESH